MKVEIYLLKNEHLSYTLANGPIGELEKEMNPLWK